METDRDGMRKRVLIVVGSLVALVAVVLGIVAVAHRGGGSPSTTTTTSSTSSTSTSTSTSATSTTAAPTTTFPSADLEDAIFPDLTAGARATDPVTLTKDFAQQVLGFGNNLVITPNFGAGATAGTVTITPTPGAGPTSVQVRKVTDGSWVIMSARAASIRLDTPIGKTRIASPQPLLGAAYAFEGRVNVMLYADGVDTPIATTFVMGRGDGVLGDFSSQVTFTPPPGATRGVLVLSAAGAKDGTTVAAVAIRVGF